MDSTQYSAYYNTCAQKFRSVANNLILQQTIGNWPIKRGPSRIMLLYMWAMSTGQDPNTPLTTNQILAINARISTFKYV